MQTCQMSFTIDKCKVLHIEYRNQKANYSMNGTELKNVDWEIDFGVTMTINLNPGQVLRKS